MTELDYQQWWQYHIRVARGESLDAEEQALYQAGAEALDKEEAEQLQLATLANLRQLRQQIQQMTRTVQGLTQQSKQLDQQIAAAEQSYQQLTGYSLLTEAHVPS